MQVPRDQFRLGSPGDPGVYNDEYFPCSSGKVLRYKCADPEVKTEISLSMRYSSFSSRPALFILLMVCLAQGFPRPISAQMNQMNMSSPVMETKDEIPPDQLPVPERLTGIGNVHIQITATPEAQAWFNQGLNLLHDFWDYESARAFEQSIRADPQCAMCYWGLLKDDPQNSAANHYFIHGVEASTHPEQALHSAEILASLAPSSGHMVHMPGHIFFRLGDYARAEQTFDASLHVDETYMREQHVAVDDDWNYVHNLMYAIANLMEEGKLKEATAYSAKLTNARGELDSTLYPFSPRDSISRLDPKFPVALRTADWPQVISLSQSKEPPASQPNLHFPRARTCRLRRGHASPRNSRSRQGAKLIRAV